MKHFASLPLLAALCLASPSTGLAKDKHKHHDHDDHDDHHSHHYNSSSGYCPPTDRYQSYRPYSSYNSYPYYGGYSSYPSYSYYSRPTIGLSFSTSPTYRTVQRSVDYDDGLAVDVQRALARRGYYRGGIDGDIGPGTRAAIRQYQYDRRLEVTGRIDRSLLRSLGVS